MEDKNQITKTLDIFTLDELEAALGITKETLRMYMKEGLLEGAKVGRRYLFTLEDVHNFIDNVKRKNKQK